MMTRRDFMQSASLSAAAALAGGKASSQPLQFDLAQVRDIGEQGFIFGLPIVMNYNVMYDYAVDRNSGQFKAPFNQLVSNHALFTYKDTAVITPNADTPYSVLNMDLRAEPLVLSVPAVDPHRYYSVQLCDGNTYNYGYIGSRATGSEAGDYLVAGPDWQGAAPAGVRHAFRSSTQFSIAIYRTQLFEPADMANVVKAQEGYKARPLSAYLKQPAPPSPPLTDFPKIDKPLIKTRFFEFLDFALGLAPAQPNEAGIRAKLASIGVGPGKTMSFSDLPLGVKLAVARGMSAGQAKVEQAIASAGKNVNGWRVGSAGGDAAFYNGDWLKRAAVAQFGIYANDAEEATYPFTRNDADGQPLDGARHKYTLTFPPGELPPVNAFWSVTMYDGKSQLLIRNPIDRYLINSPMLPGMKTDPDGSLTIVIQNRRPGPDEEANWLPAPAGPMILVMRLYWPKTEPPSILPPGEGTWQPPPVRRATT